MSTTGLSETKVISSEASRSIRVRLLLLWQQLHNTMYLF